jgi:hypothetical protein
MGDMALVMAEEHDITPAPETIMREAGGEHGNLLAVFDYPMLAVCLVCRQPVRIERKFLCEWEHVIPEQTAPYIWKSDQ